MFTVSKMEISLYIADHLILGPFRLEKDNNASHD